LLAVRALLLSEDCERHADARADGDRTTAHQPRNALRAGRDGARDDRHRSLSRAFYSQRQLVAGHCAIAACGGDVEMMLLAVGSLLLVLGPPGSSTSTVTAWMI